MGTLRSLAGKRDEPLDGFGPPFEDGLDCAFPRVPGPAGHALLFGQPAQGIPEEDTLNASVDGEPAANHADTLRALSPPQSWSQLEFVGRLASARIGGTFNFYGDGAAAARRRARLVAYLAEQADASVLLVGEAAGYRGARVSGLPFTSERQVTGSGPSEASATIVHRVLAELGLEQRVMLWNLVPTHPHELGCPNSNRPPTRLEIEAGRPFLDQLAEGRQVFAVGRIAERELDAPYVRHPSHGGASAFRAGLIAALDG
jgi:uracil-DNA glycosylase